MRLGVSVLVLGLVGCQFDPSGVTATPRTDRGVDLPSSPGVEQGVDLPRIDQGSGDGPAVDAPWPVGDTWVADAAPYDQAPSCPTSICKSCAGGVCEMDCSNGCTCPPGIPCKVSCVGSTCTNKIDCTQASSCTVTCNDSSCTNSINCPTTAGSQCTVKCTDSSCTGAVTCGPGQCNIECTGDSCTNSINCSSSCGCFVLCVDGSCTGAVTCPAGCDATGGGKGCKLAPVGTCNSC